MSDLTLEARQSFYISPPRPSGSGPGEVCCLATSTTAAAVDLSSVGAVSASLASAAGTAVAQGSVGCVGNFVSVYADGADIGIVVGPTYASVTGANAPNLSTVGSVSGTGVYTNAAGTCAHIPAGTFAEFKVAPGVDRFLGFVASAAGKIRVYQNSQAST